MPLNTWEMNQNPYVLAALTSYSIWRKTPSRCDRQSWTFSALISAGRPETKCTRTFIPHNPRKKYKASLTLLFVQEHHVFTGLHIILCRELAERG